MSRVSVELLGPIRLKVDGVERPIPRHQVRRVLAILTLRAGRRVSSDALMENLWDDRLPADPNHALHVSINRLRKVDPEVAVVVCTQPAGYVIDIPKEAVDVFRFESAAEQGRSVLDEDPVAASALLTDALELWRGPILGAFRYCEFATDAAIRLEELRLGAMEDRLAAEIRLGRARGTVPLLQELVSAHPFREHLVALLMRALEADGRRIEALAAYQAHSAMLKREFGMEPSMGTQTIAYALMRGSHVHGAAIGAEASAAPLR